MKLQSTSKSAKIAVIFSVILLLSTIIAVTSDSFAAENYCHECDITGCTVTATGFSSCTSTWWQGELQSCSTSGGGCGL